MSWEALSAICSVIGTVVVVVAAWIAVRQLREALAARQLQGALLLMQELQDVAIRGARDLLAEHRDQIVDLAGNNDSAAALDAFLQRRASVPGTPTNLVELRSCLAKLEFASALALHGAVPADFERIYLAPTLVSYWGAVQPAVDLMRGGDAHALYLQQLEAYTDLVLNGSVYGPEAAGTKRQKLAALVSRSQQHLNALGFRA